jgi:methyl-accepting chemotaxis protein
VVAVRDPSSVPVFGRLADAVRASYRRKLATALFVVLLISAAAAAGMYVQSGAVLGENVERSMTTAATAEANELTEWTGQNRLVARLLSEHPVHGTDDDARIRAYLRTQRAAREETRIVDAYVLDRRNQTVETSARRSLEGTRVADLPWEERFAFRNFDDVRMTNPYETVNGSVAIAFITPIRAKPGHLLVVAVDADGLFDRFEHPVDGGFTRVVDSNGTVVLADDPSAALEQYHDEPFRAPVVSSGLRGETGFTDSPRYGTDDGTAYVAAYAPVEGTDWVVVEHAPAASAYAVVDRIRGWIFIIGLVAAVGLVAVVAVLGADVTGALSALSRRAERLAAGEYDVEFDTDRPDEFGDLNRTLATTRDTLSRRIEELNETKAALETSNVALEERSTMVSVLNRVLRHNVRNDVNIIAGRASLAAERTDDETLRRELDLIQETALDLAAISDRTRRIANPIAEDHAEPRPITLAEELPASLDRIGMTVEEEATVDGQDAGSDPAADPTSKSVEGGPTVTVDVDPDAVAAGPATLPLAVADVVEEILEHNDEAVRIEVTAIRDPDDGTVVLRIDDDGDGLPALDVEAVGQGEETPLQHGKGLAVWCLEWTVNTVDGDLRLDTDRATVEVRLPTP